jgi:hypothetical protein
MRHLLAALTLALFTQPLTAQPSFAQVPVANVVDLTEDAPTPPLKVVDLAVGTGVHKRALQGQSEQFFARGQRLWAHVTVANAGPPTHVTMVWKHLGQVRWRIELRVGESPSWRTWSRFTMNPRRDVGAWEVEVLDAAGRSLGVSQFTVQLPADERAQLPPGPYDFGC